MKNPIFFRYEFTDETGKPEGGDVFELSSMDELKELATQILDVAHSDHVAVNFTIGREVPFYGFLKKVGLSRADVDKEKVSTEQAAASLSPAKGSQKKASKKATKKTAAKTSKKKTAKK